MSYAAYRVRDRRGTPKPSPTHLLRITGQDGAYLAQLLLDKGYVVHGVKRRSSLFNTDRVDLLYRVVTLADGLTVHKAFPPPELQGG